MAVRVKISQTAEGLWRDDRSRHGFLQRGEVGPEKLAGRRVGTARKVAVKRAVEEEMFAEHFRNRKNRCRVRNIRQHFLDHSLSPEYGALLPTRGAQPAALAGEGHQPLRLLFAL